MNNKKRNIKAVLLGLLVALIISFIWFNSFLDTTDSNKLSDIILNWLFPNRGESNGGDASFWIRKAAHFIEFAVLGGAIGTIAVFMQNNFGKYFAGFSLFAVLSVAVIDEFIQSFSDRSSSVIDILIDFGGAIFGLCLSVAIVVLFKYIKSKKK